MEVLKSLKFSLLAFLFLYLIKNYINAEQISLNNGWTLFNNQKKIKLENLSVPTSVHTALFNAKIISDPFSSYNDLKLRWITTDDNWTLQKYFQLDLTNNTCPLLINLELDSVDTIASVYLNNKFILSAKNQFLKYEVFNLTSVLNLNGEINHLQVKFKSPVNQAKSLGNQ